MKKNSHKILIVIAVIAVVLCALCVWQRENISAVIESFTMSEEDIKQRSQSDAQKVTKYLENNNLAPIRDLTEAEQKALVENRITDMQAILIMKGETTLENAEKNFAAQAGAQSGSSGDKTTGSASDGNNSAQSKPSNQPSDSGSGLNQNNSNADYNTQISDLVAQVYVIKARFTSSLRGLEQTVCNEFYSLPKSEWNNENKNRIIKKYTQSALDMQADCDAQVNDILTRLKPLLSAAGKDESIINTIKTSYENEKKSTKSMYIKKYLD